MLDAAEILARDTLLDDALALHADAEKAEARANALATIQGGNPDGVRAEAARLRRASDVALLLAGYESAILNALADGSIHRMSYEARQAERRRRAAQARA